MLVTLSNMKKKLAIQYHMKDRKFQWEKSKYHRICTFYELYKQPRTIFYLPFYTPPSLIYGNKFYKPKEVQSNFGTALKIKYAQIDADDPYD